MKRFLLLLSMLWTMCFSVHSQALTFADLKFGSAQFSDAQWDVGACMYSNTCNIYGLSGIGTTWNLGYPVTISNTQYIAFAASGDATNPWRMYLHSSNGAIVQDLGLGRFAIQGDDNAGHHFFFFTNDDWNGTVFSLSYGFSNSNGFSFTGIGSPTVPQTNTFAAGGSATPLAPGQTATTTTTTTHNPPPAPTVTSTTQSYTTRSVTDKGITYVYHTPVTTTNYSDGTSTSTTGTETLYQIVYPNYVTLGSGTPGIMEFGSAAPLSTDQQTKVNTWNTKTLQDGNQIYIDQVSGSNNTVTMDQYGNKNLIRSVINGTNNNITARQGVPGIGQNEMKLNLEGNNNVINVNQGRDLLGNPTGTNGHYLDVELSGWGTNLLIQQSNSGGVGGHYNETTINGNGNNVIEKQTDNGNKIMFVKIDGALNTVDVTQRGTGQHRLDATLTGDRNSATVLQEGTTANNATLNLSNLGGPASVNVQQNGGQSVGVSIACVTAGGCAPVTIRQGY